MTYRSNHIDAEEEANLGEVLVWAESADENYDAICEVKKIPARMGYQDDDIGLIPAGIPYFDKVIAETSYAMVSKASNLEAARKRGNARCRALVMRFHEASFGAAPKQGRESWNALIVLVERNEGFAERGALFPTGKARSLYALRARCRVAPADLSQAEIDRVSAEATAEKRKSIRKGILFLNELMGLHNRLPEVAEYLPRHELAVPASPDRAERIMWTSLPEALREDAEANFKVALACPKERAANVKQRLDAGEDPEKVLAEINDTSKLRKRLPKNKESAVAGYRSAVTWLYRAARVRGFAQGAPHCLVDLMTRETIDAACNDQITRSQKTVTLKDPTKSQCLHNRLTALKTLAKHGLKRPDIVALIELARIGNHDYVVKPGKDFSDEADRVCSMLRDTPELAARYVQAPGLLAEAAEERLAKATDDKDEAAEDAALRLYCAAALYAVQLSRPLRTSNLIRLRYRGSVEAPANITWVRNRTHAELRFQPGEIKNERPVKVHVLGEDARIFWKWLHDLRPRFLALRGLSDSPYVLPGEASPRLVKDAINLSPGCTSPSTFAELWALGREVLGLDLTPHQCRHATATLILALEPGNFAKAASVIGDTERTVENHYGKDSGEAAAVSVREALLARHPRLFKKMKGKFK